MKRRLSFVICIIILVATICGCTKEPVKHTTNESNQIVLNVWHQWSNDTNELKKKYDQAVVAYEKEHPNIKINTKTLDTEAYKTKISAEFTGEARGIDVFYYWGSGKAEKLVNAGKVLALDSYITEEIRDKIVEGATAEFEYDGKLYSLPSFSWYLTLFCNKELFDRVNADIPTTYDELKIAVDKLNTLEGVVPIASGAKDGWNAAFIYQAFILREIGADNVNAILRGEKELDQEGFKKAASKVVELYNMGAFGRNPLEEGNDDANLKFVQGKAGMRLMGSWYANGIYTDSSTTVNPDDIIAIKIPMFASNGDVADYCGGFVESFWVNNYTNHKDEAADFAIYINEFMGGAAYETGSGFSGWTTPVDESRVNPLFRQIKELLGEGKNGVLAWDTVLSSGPAEIHNEQVQALFAPNANVDEFVDNHKKIMK